MLNTSRTWAEINMSALSHNFELIKKTAKSPKICAVVKANAYGHGAVAVAKALGGADYFAVATLEEAIELRQGGIEKPILILGYTAPEGAELLVKYKITQTVFSFKYAKKLNDNAASHGRIRCHIKIDSGMGRIGFPSQNDEEKRKTVDEISKTKQLSNLDFEGIFTHFAASDMEGEEKFTKKQFDNFMTVVEMLESANITFEIKHAANSAALLYYPETHLDMVRPGIILYGLQPDGSVWDNGFEPVMSLKTTVILVKDGTDGGTVSYGRTAASKASRRYATLPLGYADGYSRLHSNNGKVIIRGKTAPVVGRVCMDQVVVDVTDIPNVTDGDTVTVIGTDGNAKITHEEFAAEEGKINYEAVCEIGPRVHRVYKKQTDA